MSEQFTAEMRFAFRRAFTWWETYIAFGMGLILASAFISGAIKDTLLKESAKRVEEVKIQTDRVNAEVAKIRGHVEVLSDRSEQSVEDRHRLNADRVRLDDRLSSSEKNQANLQHALENAQKSFNEARDVLRRIEQRGHP